MTTITVALGTSTPTSMTVVATSTSTSPAGEGAASRRPSRPAAIRPCSTATRSPCSGPSASIGGHAPATASGGRGSASSSGAPRLVLRRRLVAADARAHHVRLLALRDLLAHPLPGPVEPVRASRPPARRGLRSASGRGQLGERRDLEVAEHGHRDGARDRGRGHHQHVRRRVPAFARSASRCSTPKRCCSSTTTRPEVGEVPPAPRSARGCRRRCRRRRRRCRAAPPGGPPPACEPVSSATRVPSSAPPSMPPARPGRPEHGADRAVVLLGQHLGGREQRRLAAGVDHLEHARSATRVLPEPTSPWSSRCIGCGRRGRRGSAAPTACWPCGQRERQPRRRTRPAARRPPARGLAAPAARGGAPALGQHQPGAQRPRRTAAAAAPRPPRPRVAAGGSAERLASASRPRSARTAAGSGSGTSPAIAGRARWRRWIVPGLDAVGRRVDREERPVAGGRASASPPRRPRRRALVRVGQLPPVAEGADLAGEQPGGRRAAGRACQSATCLACEEGERQLGPSVDDRDLEPVGQPPRLRSW